MIDNDTRQMAALHRLIGELIIFSHNLLTIGPYNRNLGNSSTFQEHTAVGELAFAMHQQMNWM